MKCNFGKTIQSRKTGREAATTGWLKLYGTPTEMTNELCAHTPLSPASENRLSTDIRRQMDALQSLGKDCCIKATMFLETHPMFLKKHTFPQTSWILLSSSSAITSPLSIEMFHRCGSIQWVHHLEGGHPAWNHRPVSSWGRIFFSPWKRRKVISTANLEEAAETIWPPYKASVLSTGSRHVLLHSATEMNLPAWFSWPAPWPLLES